jgi:LPS-assembly lipoprotein
LLLTSLLTLTSCGFHPLYGSHASNSASASSSRPELSQIHIDTIADRQGQKLRNDLIDILQPGGEAPGPLYHLTATYNESQVNLGLQNNAVTTRGQLTLSVSYVLTSFKDGKPVTSGSGQAITAYNIQTSEFATILSRDDAEDRALRQLAEDIALRLGLFFEKKAVADKVAGTSLAPSSDQVPAIAPTTNASGAGAGGGTP